MRPTDAPDFERITQRILNDVVGHGEIRAVVSHTLGAAIVDALRLVWNARSAADIS